MIRFASPLKLILLALLAVVTLAGFILIPQATGLPVHWNVAGEADIVLDRNWALLQMPATVAIIWAIFWAIERFGGEARREAAAAVLNVALAAITGLMVLIQGVIVLVGLGVEVNVLRVVIAGVALMQIALGNVMPKSRPNGVAGIRVRTALTDPANWAATHRLAGALTMLAGLLLFAAALLLPVGIWLLVAVFAAWIVPLGTGALYSVLRAGRSAA